MKPWLRKNTGKSQKKSLVYDTGKPYLEHSQRFDTVFQENLNLSFFLSLG